MTFSLWHIGSTEASVTHKKSSQPRPSLYNSWTQEEALWLIGPKFMIKFDVY